MTNIIAVTSIAEQEQVMRELKKKLLKFSSSSFSIIQSINKIDVYHEIDSKKCKMLTYLVVFIPTSMATRNLIAFPSDCNINVSLVLRKLDRMREDVLFYSDRHNKKKELTKAVNLLFDQE